MRNNNPLNIIKSEKINWQGEVKPSTDPNFAQFETLEYGLPGGGVYQGSESAYGDCTRRSTASNETGDAGTLVRHRTGYGYGGVRTEWQGTAGTGAVCCTRLHTSLVRPQTSRVLSFFLAFCPKVFEGFIFCRIVLHDRGYGHSGSVAKSFLKYFILCVLGNNLLLHLV